MTSLSIQFAGLGVEAETSYIQRKTWPVHKEKVPYQILQFQAFCLTLRPHQPDLWRVFLPWVPQQNYDASVKCSTSSMFCGFKYFGRYWFNKYQNKEDSNFLISDKPVLFLFHFTTTAEHKFEFWHQWQKHAFLRRVVSLVRFVLKIICGLGNNCKRVATLANR